ncbi:MAG: UvrD-helicase domain-containing protein [Propionivibrio sp.]
MRSIPRVASSSKPAPAAARHGCWRRASCAFCSAASRPARSSPSPSRARRRARSRSASFDWLHLLATGSEAQVIDFLAERGVSADSMLVRAARGLYERVLGAQPALAVNTFHGWFLQLVDAAPLSANLAGATLAESDSRLFDELWQSFAAGLQKAPDDGLTQRFVRLLGDVGLDSTRRLIRRALDRRSEWLAFADDGADAATKIIDTLREQLGAGEPGEALRAFFDAEWPLDFHVYLGFLETSELKGDQDAAANLRGALGEEDRARSFEGLRSVLLTKENTLRSKKPGKALDKRFTPEGALRFLDLHAQLGERVIACLERQTAERILAFNEDACAVFSAFLAHVEVFKQARRQIDFVDAEWNVLKLLRDEQTAAFLQARLDARYRHVLLDEFQDTNPLQWQILLAWLDAYSDASRPIVFLVGDPKQSIYRFRRAEPRLFAVAADFLERQFGALRCEQDATRRNAKPIIDVVNALFLGVPEFMPFRAQSSFAGALPGRVELLPLFGNAEEEAAAERSGLRNPLIEAEVEPEDARRRREAEALAAKIAAIVGSGGPAWLVNQRGADGRSVRRPARYGDFMLLVRSRTHLADYERAFAAAGIPFDAGSRGGLLSALEVRDVVALLEFFVTPLADLKLAQTLRSPIFACSDEEMILLARRREASWWHRLGALAQDGAAPPRLARAARLLGEWLPAADLLPAHDLLDRIFHQGEVPARYRLAVPEAAAAGVEANLRALLLLALDVNGGRYPSLPRFIDELRALRDADTNDAPDEGEIAAHDADAGRVRILTIHGAKGLEAPIVWLLGANDAPRAGESWDVIVNWPPTEATPRHFSFFGRKEERGAARQPMFAAEAEAAKREELNLLYVAVTRARQVFIASGIENAKGKEGTPYRLLEAALGKLGGEPSLAAYGDALPTTDRAPLASPPATSTARADTPAALPAVGERRMPSGAAERFGTLLHALLERRTDGTDDERWWADMGFDDGEYRRVAPIAERLLAAPALRRFFDPALYLRAWNELELTGGDGGLQRLDRLVELDSGFWVLDYKSSGSGTGRLDDYRAQVAAYCATVAGVFRERPVRGALIFADGSVVEVG